jgi:hypothetical protein
MIPNEEKPIPDAVIPELSPAEVKLFRPAGRSSAGS